MGMALQVVLLVVAIVVAVGGLGAALALRLSARQRLRRRPVAARSAPGRQARAAAPPRTRAAPAAPPAPTATRPAAAATTKAAAPPPTPEQAHQARLDALQALLALGDAKAGQTDSRFADTQPVDDDDPPTLIADRGGPGRPSPLLNLDQLPGRRRP